MTGVDANLLIYAHRRDSPFHSKAKELMKGLAEGDASWAIPWPSVHEFLAISTHPRIYKPPSSLDEALRQLDIWFESPTLTLIGEMNGYSAILRRVLDDSGVVGPRIHDARIAAICIQHGVRTFWSADRDLTRFGELRAVNPLTNGRKV
jgi:toxin-antitoxin system PIN domain toxin